MKKLFSPKVILGVIAFIFVIVSVVTVWAEIPRLPYDEIYCTAKCSILKDEPKLFWACHDGCMYGLGN